MTLQIKGLEYEFKEGKVLPKYNVEEAKNIVFNAEKLVQELEVKVVVACVYGFKAEIWKARMIVPREKFTEASYSKTIRGDRIVNHAEEDDEDKEEE